MTAAGKVCWIRSWNEKKNCNLICQILGENGMTMVQTCGRNALVSKQEYSKWIPKLCMCHVRITKVVVADSAKSSTCALTFSGVSARLHVSFFTTLGHSKETNEVVFSDPIRHSIGMPYYGHFVIIWKMFYWRNKNKNPSAFDGITRARGLQWFCLFCCMTTVRQLTSPAIDKWK